MNNSKYSKVRPSSFTGAIRSPRSKGWGKLHYNVGLLILAGVTSVLVIMFGREGSEDSVGLIDDFKRMISSSTEEYLQQPWNYSSYSFKPNVSDWDEQRLTWLTEHQNLRPRAGGKPRVLMTSGSAPNPCSPTILSHLLLRASKNKLDYSRNHDIEYFYNLGEPDQDFSDCWVKLPVVRMLMLQHPEADWIWWFDADAVITDLSFEPPYAELEHDNLVLYGEERHVYDKRTWKGLSTANFLIRNCQWSLDLLDEWASMGTASVREESGNFQSGLLTDRPLRFPGDDQSGLVALLAQDKRNRIGKQRWAPMVKLVKETEYTMAANWSVVVPTLEELSLENKPVPFVTHFTGCLPSCNIKPELSKHFLDACVEQLGRAFDFADNQVYKQFGFKPRKLGDQLKPYEKKPIDHKKEFTADGEEVFRILPRYPDWDERRRKYMQEHPPTSRDEVILVSGSAPKPCLAKQGSHMLLRGLKNLVDYSRKNDVILFYNNAAIDKNLTGWWSKLPLLKMMMINNPGTEWVWWLDSDAVLTDMDYRFDFARYNASGVNVVMYGVEVQIYEERKYNGINTGNFLIRNCQWSLDLLDRWASFGATLELRVTNEPLLNNFLSNRPPGWDADDQSCLVYLLVTEREKWGTKSRLEYEISMSGYWEYWIALFGDEYPAEERPFVTHFAGCEPCQDPQNDINVRCLKGMDETYNFADNQVLEKYGLRHVHLNSTELLQRSSIVSKSPTVIEIVEIDDTIEGEPEDNTFEVSKEEKVDTSEEKKVVEKTVDMPDKEKVKKPEQEEVDASVEKSADSREKSTNFKSANYKPAQEEVDASEEKSDVIREKSSTFKSATYKKPYHENEEEESELPEAKVTATNQEEDFEIPEKKLVTNDDRFGRAEE